MDTHTSHSSSHTSLGTRVAGVLVGAVLLLGLAGCGKEAGTDAVIVLGAADVTWTLPDDYGDGVNTIAPIMPIQIQVQKSADDATPVAGAEVTVLVGGVSITGAMLLDPVSGTLLDNGFGVLQTHTDDHGALIVLPRGTVTGCTAPPATDTTVTGNLSIGVFISSDSANWNGNFSYTCHS